MDHQILLVWTLGGDGTFWSQVKGVVGQDIWGQLVFSNQRVPWAGGVPASSVNGGAVVLPDRWSVLLASQPPRGNSRRSGPVVTITESV